jgi:hypothetical protein
MYIFPDDQAPNALEMMRTHAMEGQLHPYAAMVLMHMVENNDD